MLVLSRREGEAIVLGGEMIVTVARLFKDSVELSVTRPNGFLLATHRAHERESVTVADGVRLVVIASRDGKVRLGMDYPPDLSVHRLEAWDRWR